jgi:hypothetical protein
MKILPAESIEVGGQVQTVLPTPTIVGAAATSIAVALALLRRHYVDGMPHQSSQIDAGGHVPDVVTNQLLVVGAIPFVQAQVHWVHHALMTKSAVSASTRMVEMQALGLAVKVGGKTTAFRWPSVSS